MSHFHNGAFQHPLAYIKWFIPFNQPGKTSGMYTIRRNAAVVSVEYIVRTCHLMGKCGRKIDYG
ncbi:hypothetical protein DFH08DRAFT_722267 [Mycena albidolilacea]|uniref:Uncharacterized protein n=1 Tax=Mycena albidolilacea TaxID=1033008 RepID=A0AAD6Z1E2_9AGAR|nr:hypothetical protein DFH08DRAFT_722267 [Mycena albidolilacea]